MEAKKELMRVLPIAWARLKLKIAPKRSKENTHVPTMPVMKKDMLVCVCE